MYRQVRQRKPPLIILVLLTVLLLACRGLTNTANGKSLAREATPSIQRIGFDFSEQIPSSPEGDISAAHHLFIHKYPIPFDGFITGLVYLNDSDKVPETFDLLILRPHNGNWTVIFRITLSDDTPPAQTGITLVNLPYPLPVQKGDIFAHWQHKARGAIPLNTDESSVDGFSAGQHGFQSSDVEVGERIKANGFSGQRDYFINLIFSTNP